MKKFSALIIDDNEIDCYLLERELEETDYDIRIFKKSDGVEALEFLQNYELNKIEFGDEFPPLIIFLDINMPLMDGLEFLQAYSQVRIENQLLKSTIVMMFTSSKNPKDIQGSLDYDFVSGYLVKGEYTADKLKGFIGSIAG